MTPFLDNEVRKMIERLEAQKAEARAITQASAAANADVSSEACRLHDYTPKRVWSLRKLWPALTLALTLVLSMALVGCGETGTDSGSTVNSYGGATSGSSGYENSTAVQDSAASVDSSSSYDSTDSITSNATPTAESTSDTANPSATGSDAGAATSDTGATEQSSERKVIVDISYELETKDMDATLSSLESAVQASGGFIQSSDYTGYTDSDYYKYASLVCRVPASGVESFKTEVKAAGNVVAESVSGQDISYDYYDIEGRLEVLRLEESRLLEILESSGTITEMLEVEGELSRVRADIESLTGTLQKYDDLVELATVNISVQNVSDYSPPAAEKSFLDQLGEAFIASFTIALDIAQGLLITLVYLLPYLVVIGVVVLIVVLFVKRSNKRRRKFVAEHPPVVGGLPNGQVGAAYPSVVMPSVERPNVAQQRARQQSVAQQETVQGGTQQGTVQLPLNHPPIGQPPTSVSGVKKAARLDEKGDGKDTKAKD